jgi:peptide/nickel transport system permease protein
MSAVPDLVLAEAGEAQLIPPAAGGRRTRLRWSLRLGVALLLLITIVSLAAPLIAPYGPNAQNLGSALLPPGSPGHLLGTDQFGRDTLSRLLYAGRIDLLLAFGATVIPLVIGTLAGLAAGYLGGAVDTVLMRVADVIFAFPFLVLVLAVVAIFGPGLRNLLLAIWAVAWVSYARLVRGEVLAARNQEYVMAARALGFSRRRIVLVHILPNVAGAPLVFGAINAVNNLALGAALGFLGLGVQPPTAEWGNMIATSQNYIVTDWWLVALPGACIVLLGLALTLIGDGSADMLRVAR